MEWDILSVHSFPLEDDVDMAYKSCPVPFRITTIDKARPYSRNIQDFVNTPAYCNY